jgi:phospholipase C
MTLRFEHIVVLMLENRSFDHLFGFLGKGEGVPAGTVNYLKPGDKSSKAFRVGRGGDFTAIGEGPSHSLKQTNEQLFGMTQPGGKVAASKATMDGFVASFRTSLQHDLKREPTDSELQQVMNSFLPEQLPVLSTLAKAFVLCDQWFADVPGQTMPNRAFVHAATSQGYTYNANWKLRFNCPTLYDRINAAARKGKNVSWRVYYHDQNDVLELYPKVEKSATSHVQFEGNFLNDVATDHLATYSFITPAFMHSAQHLVNSMHAPADVRPAEELVADVYAALKADQAVWQRTLFIVLFDEHGGYHDHMKLPATVSPDGIDGRTDEPFLVPFDFKRLGLRVPCILVSPWFTPSVDSTVYSHASIPGSVIEAFALGDPLTERDKAANKLTRKYLQQSPGQKWRTDIPDLNVPVQPQRIDFTQREMLDGSVHLDPHPGNRKELRTRDINDPVRAGLFMRTQATKHMEHYLAAGGSSARSAKLTASTQMATGVLSAARISELRRTTSYRRERRP